MTDTEADTATLIVHICAERHSYRVTFATQAQLIAYLRPRMSTHAWWEPSAAEMGDDVVAVPATWTDALEFLYPTCAHGMNASDCYGPDHFMSADQERAMGWDYADAPAGF